VGVLGFFVFFFFLGLSGCLSVLVVFWFLWGLGVSFFFWLCSCVSSRVGVCFFFFFCVGGVFGVFLGFLLVVLWWFGPGFLIRAEASQIHLV